MARVNNQFMFYSQTSIRGHLNYADTLYSANMSDPPNPEFWLENRSSLYSN